MIKEAVLPGVGKKFSVALKGDIELVVVVYNSGKRELYITSDEEILYVVDFSEEQAKELGLVLAGLSYNPLPSRKMEIIMKEMVMEWVELEEGSPYIGKTIAQMNVRKNTGASIIALVRHDKIIPSPDPDTEIMTKGDIIVAVGTRAHIQALMKMCDKCRI